MSVAAPLYIDGREHPSRPDRNLLEVCLALGLDLPYFCWHPALGSVGACRQCAVKLYKDEHDRAGRIVMSCMTPAAPGTRISLADPEAHHFRASVIEWLMTNHPHDCPVCDEGGECHLQDMTVMTGHTYRRYRGTKRTFRNQHLGPFVNHEMNRCITCYRCVRFYRDYAGGHDLQALASKNHVYFGRDSDGTLESEFSGNLVEVCPTGVFTDRTLKPHYTRKWDLQSAPSVCVHCGAGCNTLVAERYGRLRRVLNRYNDAVNGFFLCDRGRFGHGFVHADQRLRTPLLRAPDEEAPRPAARADALVRVGKLLEDRGAVLGIGSPRASLESNFALRALVGESNFVAGVSDGERPLLALVLQLCRELPVAVATLGEIEGAGAVLVLGEDVCATAPRVALALRQSVRNGGFAVAAHLKIARWDDTAVRTAAQDARSPLFVATPAPTRLDDIAAAVRCASPDELARIGCAIAHEIDASAPEVADLDADARAFARDAATALRVAERPLVVSGTGCASEPVLRAAAAVALALARAGRRVRVSWVVPECNSLGLAALGGQPLSEAFARARDRRARTVIVLENDLYRRAPGRLVDELLASARVIVIDHLAHATARRAAACLPAGTFAESSGTLVNGEGRAQRFFRVLAPEGDVADSWRWLGALGQAPSVPGRDALDELTRACAQAIPALRRIVDAAPDAGARWAGQRVPRQPQPYSGRTAMRAQISVHEPEPPADPDAPLAFSMEGYPLPPPPPLVTHYWAPRWNSCQSLKKFGVELGDGLHGASSGVRLFEPAVAAPAGFRADAPPPFRRRGGALLAVPRPLVFGTEELSMLAPAVAERAGTPAVLLNATDGTELGLAPGTEVELATDDAACRRPVELDERVPRGVALVPVGAPDLPWLDVPAWATLRRAGPA